MADVILPHGLAEELRRAGNAPDWRLAEIIRSHLKPAELAEIGVQLIIAELRQQPLRTISPASMIIVGPER